MGGGLNNSQLQKVVKAKEKGGNCNIEWAISRCLDA